MTAPDAKTKLAAIGLEEIVGTPEGLRKWLVDERARWGAVVKATGMKLD